MSRERLEKIVAAIRSRHSLESDDLEFVADVLEKLLRADNPKKEIGLNKKRGRKGPWTWDLDERTAIAIAVIGRMKPYGEMNRDDAFEAVARLLEDGDAEYGKKVRTVRRYYDDHLDVAKHHIKCHGNDPTLAFANLLGIELIPDSGPTNK